MTGPGWARLGVARRDPAGHGVTRQARLGGTGRGKTWLGMARLDTAVQAGRGDARPARDEDRPGRAWRDRARLGEAVEDWRSEERLGAAWGRTARQAWLGRAGPGVATLGFGDAWRARSGASRQDATRLGGARLGRAGEADMATLGEAWRTSPGASRRGQPRCRTARQAWPVEAWRGDTSYDETRQARRNRIQTAQRRRKSCPATWMRHDPLGRLYLLATAAVWAGVFLLLATGAHA